MDNILFSKKDLKACGENAINGSNTTVLPNFTFSECSALCVQSLLSINSELLSVYAGVPVKKIKARNEN